eukprot:TRINITY_DN922_c0_g1_i1.p1 TRINITY_DN922_c0_g1~~TRINITY_DN922_c0_g1_i1.p1  ORF type:complete len:1079 (+),score=398.27 TRINITY_DN922_c0_g1_i1:135-3239(+)
MEQMRTLCQEPLLVVDAQLPFSHPATAAKFRRALGLGVGTPSDGLGGYTLHHSAPGPGGSARRGGLIPLGATPDSAGLQTGMAVYISSPGEDGQGAAAAPSQPAASPRADPCAAGLAAPRSTGSAAAAHSLPSPGGSLQRVTTTPLATPAPPAGAALQTPAPCLPPPPPSASAAYPPAQQPPRAGAAAQPPQGGDGPQHRAEAIVADFLRQKNDMAEATLHARREMEMLRQRARDAEELAAAAEAHAARGNQGDEALRRENAELRREVSELRQANAQHSRRERETALTLESLQLGVEVAEERGRRDYARRLAAAEQEVAEAREFTAALKERLIAQAADIKRLTAPKPDTRHTEHIILPAGALRRLVTVNGGGAQHFREKYGVEIELVENTMTVTGDLFSIRLLKEECEQALGLSDAAAPAAAASPRRDAAEQQWAKREAELLAQLEAFTQQQQAAAETIESLHTALRHAQDRCEADLAATRELREAQQREQQRREAEHAELRAVHERMQRELAAKSAALDDANRALASTMETFRLEHERSQGSKLELGDLRGLVEKQQGDLREMQHELFLAKETIASLTKVNKTLQAALDERDQQVSHLPALEAALADCRGQLAEARGEVVRRAEEASAERGRLTEKNMRIQEALDAAVAQLDEARRTRDALATAKRREEELEALLRAAHLQPDPARLQDQEREILRLREEAQRHLRDHAALGEALSECRQRMQELMTDNERLKELASRASLDSQAKGHELSALSARLEEERVMAQLNSEKRSLQAESLGATLAARERELTLLRERVSAQSELAGEVESLRSELRAAVAGGSDIPSIPSMPRVSVGTSGAAAAAGEAPSHRDGAPTITAASVRSEFDAKLAEAKARIDAAAKTWTSVSPRREVSPLKPISPSSAQRGSPSASPAMPAASRPQTLAARAGPGISAAASRRARSPDRSPARSAAAAAAAPAASSSQLRGAGQRAPAVAAAAAPRSAGPSPSSVAAASRGPSVSPVDAGGTSGGAAASASASPPRSSDRRVSPRRER